MTEHQHEHDRHEHERATADRPRNAPGKRPLLVPALAVVGLIVLIAAIFLLLTWVQQNH